LAPLVRNLLLISLKYGLMSNKLPTMVTLVPLRTLADTGAHLRALRLQSNRTQAEVSTAVGLSRRALSALESSSAADVRFQTLLKLLRYYNAQLMVGPESPVPTLAELDFERRAAKSAVTANGPQGMPTRERATGQRRRAKE
jgi:transcriptional regulator with XRE-family HTH domain